ncbi:hypothetical protein E4U09_007338 [Claviceps aff. purpurea]|uniref:Protein kinase domain-containing protein n=1 Tax=Claviceps aff. purpurea TaxID=1967640 RepID=A0A9P7U2W3_9HYPO|nr:hypothetical protein E4U09_007338 [Claviceps aff. purpurea]
MGRTSYEQAGMARFEIPRSRLIEQADDKGVLHRDVGWENVLFNPETKGVMVIDFERADLLDKSTSARQDAAGELETPEKTTQQLRAASCAVKSGMMLSLLYKNDCSLKCTSLDVSSSIFFEQRCGSGSYAAGENLK